MMRSTKKRTRPRTTDPARGYAGRHRDTTAAGLTRANLREDLAARGLVPTGRHRPE